MTSLSGVDVVLVSRPGDEHGDALEERLTALDARAMRVSLETVAELGFTWELNPMSLRIGTSDIRMGARGFWRRPGRVIATGIDVGYRELAAREWREAFMTAALTFVDWLTPPHVIGRAETKGYQLLVASALGYRVPRTLLTSDIDDARHFQDMTATRIIAKPVRYGLVSKDPLLVAYTTEVNLDSVDGIGGVPIILQELIQAERHLRVVTVNSRAFVSELVTTDLDWRAVRENHARFTRVADDDYGVGDAAVRVARALDLNYSSQDWIRTDSGGICFLEANPNGQWLFLDPPHGGAITQALAEAILGSYA